MDLYLLDTSTSQLDTPRKEYTSIEMRIIQAVYKEGLVAGDVDRYFNTPPVA
jgi:hypothetical protein